MKFGEYDCECGANVCGDADRSFYPTCPNCNRVGTWTRIRQNDFATALEDTDIPDPLEGAIIQPDDPFPGTVEFAFIQPDDPIPPRQLKYQDWHECRCGVEYSPTHYPNCPDCGLESIPENAAEPFVSKYTDEDRQNETDLMKEFELAMSAINRYNHMREEMGLDPLDYIDIEAENDDLEEDE